MNALLAHCGDLAASAVFCDPGSCIAWIIAPDGRREGRRDPPGLARLRSTPSIGSIGRCAVYPRGRGPHRSPDRAPSPRSQAHVGRDEERQASITNWRVLRRFPRADSERAEVRPETGRTHQIRVHLSSAGLPLVGDTVYGRARGNDARLGRPALHAAHLGFEHPIHGRRLVFDTRLPDDLLEWIADLGPEEAVE